MNGRYRTNDGKATIEWTLKDKENGKEFSAQGQFDGHAGQCLDHIAAAYPGDPKVQEIVKVWREYHLNGMHAGTPEQERAIKDAKENDGYGVDEWHTSLYALACKALQDRDLYEVPITEDLKKQCTPLGDWPAHVEVTEKKRCFDGEGFYDDVIGTKHVYRYGERWLFWPLPAAVIKRIESWGNWDQPEDDHADHVAKTFLKENGIECQIKRGSRKTAPFSDHCGHHYSVTLRREDDKRNRIVFDFWGSLHDVAIGRDVTPGDVFECIRYDAQTPDTFEDFCAAYGHDNDSREAERTFKRCRAFAEKLQRFFDEDEIEQLANLDI